MYLDAFTIAALVDEFMDTLIGGRVQDVVATDPTGYGFEIYAHRQRRYLYVSADKQAPRVLVVPDKLRRGVYRPSQMNLMLRSYIEGGTVTHVSQPPWERILFIDVEHPARGESRLVIEPMGRRANFLLVHDGVILDCVHRIGPEDNSYRLSLPNHAYQMPPPLEGRYDPYQVTVDEIQTILDTSDKPEKDKTFRVVPRKLLGFSPLLAREVVYRACGDLDQRVATADASAIHTAIQDLMPSLQKRDWRAGIGLDDEGDVVAYSVYPLTHTPDWQAVATISTAMTEYYGAAVGDEAYNQAKKPVQEAIEEGKARFRSKLHSLRESLRDRSEIERLQQSGELILAYQYTIDPDQVELVAQYNPDEDPLTISLNPDLTPLENAQKYFDKYNRAKRAQDSVPQLITDAQHEYDYMLQLENDLKQASNWVEIDDVIQALQDKGITIGKKNKKMRRIGGGGRTAPLKLDKDGYIIWVGRNSRQNEEVTFRKANSDDFWLHARDVPGAHVVIRYDGRHIPDDLIEAAASIAAHYSPKQTDAKVDVILTRCKYVKPIKGAGPGMVTFRNERTLTVTPQDEAILT